MIRPRLALPILLALLLAAAASAAPHETGEDGVSETLLRAMKDEMARTLDQLRLEHMERPYFVAQTVYEQRGLWMEGSFGAVARPREYGARTLKIDLRVGSREFDDSHFIPADYRSYMPSVGNLPLEDDYDALRFEIWSLSDRAYKQALGRLSRKQAYRDAKNIAELIPDLSEDPVGSSRTIAALSGFDRDAWEQRLRDASAVFRDYPRIHSSSVRLSLQAEHVYFVDSEGRSFVRPSHVFEIQIQAQGLADDGMEQSMDLAFVEPTVEALPGPDELRAAVEKVARGVTALAGAPQAEIYLGPVLLEGVAAARFFDQLLATGLSNARKPWAEQEWAERYYQRGNLLERLGLRVISPIFDVYDDPAAASFEGRALAGHYAVDDQGIPARRVDLIEKGILADLLMSRSPIEQRDHSNGHGRGTPYDLVDSHVGNLFLEAAMTIPAAEMKRRLREEAAAFGLDHGILIRHIAPSNPRDTESLLATPVLTYKVDVATGEEQLVRDARFDNVTLRALRDIVVASTERRVYNMKRRGGAYARGTIPSSLVYPSVLLAEMELAQSEEQPEKTPYLPHPYFTPVEREEEEEPRRRQRRRASDRPRSPTGSALPCAR